MKTKTLLGVLVLVVMPVLMVYLFMQRAGLDTEDPVNDAVVAVAPRPAPPAGDGPISGDKVSRETGISRSPYSIPLPSLEGVDWQLSGVWVSEEGVSPEVYQVYLIFSNELRISMGGSFGWSPFDDISNINTSGPFRLATVNENNARGKDAGVNILFDGTRAPYPASLSWVVNNVQMSLLHPSWSMERLKEIAESMPTLTWKPGIRESVVERLGEGSVGNVPSDDESVPPPAFIPPEEDAPGPDQDGPGQ